MVAVDIDEVLFPFAVEFVAFNNREYGDSLAVDDFFCYELERVLGLTVDEAVERLYSFCGADHDHVKPLQEAQASIATLASRYDIAGITARDARFRDNTADWLRKNQIEIAAGVTHVGYAPIMEKPKKKVEVCQELGAIALIDDSLGHVTECAERGLTGVLFGDYPWNQADELPQNVVRCADWPAVLEYFDGRG